MQHLASDLMPMILISGLQVFISDENWKFVVTL
jgi:hypothetical protein